MDQRVTLPDGRKLGFAEHGDPKGQPLLWFPGTPHSRLSGPRDERWVAEHGLRFISVERPGFGISDLLPDRRLVDWPRDVEHLADELALERFLVAGTSGGGPYVAVCAALIPQRILGAAIVAGFGPMDLPGAARGMAPSRRLMALLFRHTPGIVARIARRLPLGRHPELIYRYMARAIRADRSALDATWDERMRDVREALRPGIAGLVQELRIVTGPWGFRLEEIPIDIQLWHGEEDAATPIGMARQMADRIPSCRRHFIAGAGHLLWQTHQIEILSGLAELAALESRGD